MIPLSIGDDSVPQHVPNNEMHLLAVINSFLASPSILCPTQEPKESPIVIEILIIIKWKGNFGLK
jgi:hypothetical protein